MKAQSLTLAGALVLSATSFAQTDASADLHRFDPSKVNYAGVYDVATQQLRHASNSGLSRNAGGVLSSYGQDWEAVGLTDPAAVSNDGWLCYVNVFDGGGGFQYGYFAGGAPNGGPSFSAIGTGDGGADQGAQYLNVYSDYNNGDHGGGSLIEANVFKEFPVGAADVGNTWTFQFDHLRNPVVTNGEASTNTQAFIKVLQSSNGSFAQLAFNTFDTTGSSPTAWATDSIDITIDPSWVGELLQIGFMSTATNYDDTGRFYDNLSFSQDAGGPSLGEPIYNNTAPSGFFYNVAAGQKVIDEGLIPRPSTIGFPGTFDSYDLSSLNLAYVTDATDPSLGGDGVGIELEIFESYSVCGASADSETPVAVISLTGLPGSTSGGLAGVSVDVDLTSLDLCLRAEGRDGLINSASQRFGWSFRVTDYGDGTACGPFIAGDPNNVPEGDGTTWQNPTGQGTGLATADAFLLEGPGGGCFFFGGYPANIFASFAIVLRSGLSGDCIGCGNGDDNFEENDDIASATPIGLGATNGLVQDVDADFFAYTIPDGQNLRIDALFAHAVSDLDMYLYDSTGATLDQGFSGTDDETITYANCSGGDQQLFIEIDNFGAACNDYDLVLSEITGLAADVFEDNDDCASAIPLPLGLTRTLTITEDACTGAGDFDYYSVPLPDGATLTVDILFDNSVADLDLFAYDTSIGCDGNTSDPATLDFGFSASDNENIRVVNDTGVTIDIVVRVDRFGSGENSYEMLAQVTTNETYGEVICSGNDNSTSRSARLTASGSDVASNNALVLDVNEAANQQFGLFFASQDDIRVDIAGSDGTLCIGSLTIARFNDSLVETSVVGAASYTPNLASIPFENGGSSTPFAVMAGDSLNFQFWYRDVRNDPMSPTPVPTSNFSDAIAVTFQ